MKHFIFKIFFAFFLVGNLYPSYGQCPPGNVYFTTQAEVDNFAVNYPNCTVINGNLDIQGFSSITNLSGLSQIIEVDGYLQIMSSLTLNSLSGLDNLQSVGDFLRIGDINVSTLTGLDNLSSVSGNFIVIENNDNLQNLNGLGQL